MINAQDGYLIRRATPRDADLVVQGINTICAEGGAFYTTQFVPTPQWNAVLHYPDILPDHLLLVAEWDGSFVGASRLFPGAENTLSRHAAQLGMFVLPPYRCKGIGRSLLKYMISWATDIKLEKVFLSVFSTNQPAIRLYQKFGFVEEGRQLSQIKLADGQYVDLLLMAYFVN